MCQNHFPGGPAFICSRPAMSNAFVSGALNLRSGPLRAFKILGSDHVTVRIRRSEFEELLDDFLKCMDQPTIDGLNTYLVSRAGAMQGLKVALSGVGGDELFGGYPSFGQIPKLLTWGRR